MGEIDRSIRKPIWEEWMRRESESAPESVIEDDSTEVRVLPPSSSGWRPREQVVTRVTDETVWRASMRSSAQLHDDEDKEILRFPQPRRATPQPPAPSPSFEPTKAAVYDPLRFCIFTTIALAAWALSPPVAVMLMSGMGLWAFGRGRAHGLGVTKSFLLDTRLLMTYLGAAFVAGTFFAWRTLLQLLG
jgi:hypothetical protein